ncbi:unnamed protein product [Dicrocoelium dendriticum]|nr:unnamed protein product [Dicrocoelium dendriticum]
MKFLKTDADTFAHFGRHQNHQSPETPVCSPFGIQPGIVKQNREKFCNEMECHSNHHTNPVSPITKPELWPHTPTAGLHNSRFDVGTNSSACNSSSFIGAKTTNVITDDQACSDKYVSPKDNQGMTVISSLSDSNIFKYKKQMTSLRTGTTDDIHHNQAHSLSPNSLFSSTTCSSDQMSKGNCIYGYDIPLMMESPSYNPLISRLLTDVKQASDKTHYTTHLPTKNRSIVLTAGQDDFDSANRSSFQSTSINSFVSSRSSSIAGTSGYDENKRAVEINPSSKNIWPHSNYVANEAKDMYEPFLRTCSGGTNSQVSLMKRKNSRVSHGSSVCNFTVISDEADQNDKRCDEAVNNSNANRNAAQRHDGHFVSNESIAAKGFRDGMVTLDKVEKFRKLGGMKEDTSNNVSLGIDMTLYNEGASCVFEDERGAMLPQQMTLKNKPKFASRMTTESQVTDHHNKLLEDLTCGRQVCTSEMLKFTSPKQLNANSILTVHASDNYITKHNTQRKSSGTVEERRTSVCIEAVTPLYKSRYHSLDNIRRQDKIVSPRTFNTVRPASCIIPCDMETSNRFSATSINSRHSSTRSLYFSRNSSDNAEANNGEYRKSFTYLQSPKSTLPNSDKDLINMLSKSDKCKSPKNLMKEKEKHSSFQSLKNTFQKISLFPVNFKGHKNKVNSSVNPNDQIMIRKTVDNYEINVAGTVSDKLITSPQKFDEFRSSKMGKSFLSRYESKDRMDVAKLCGYSIKMHDVAKDALMCRDVSLPEFSRQGNEKHISITHVAPNFSKTQMDTSEENEPDGQRIITRRNILINCLENEDFDPIKRCQMLPLKEPIVESVEKYASAESKSRVFPEQTASKSLQKADVRSNLSMLRRSASYRSSKNSIKERPEYLELTQKLEEQFRSGGTPPRMANPRQVDLSSNMKKTQQLGTNYVVSPKLLTPFEQAPKHKVTSIKPIKKCISEEDNLQPVKRKLLLELTERLSKFAATSAEVNPMQLPMQQDILKSQIFDSGKAAEDKHDKEITAKDSSMSYKETGANTRVLSEVNIQQNITREPDPDVAGSNLRGPEQNGRSVHSHRLAACVALNGSASTYSPNSSQFECIRNYFPSPRWISTVFNEGNLSANTSESQCLFEDPNRIQTQHFHRLTPEELGPLNCEDASQISTEARADGLLSGHDETGKC